ncbi:MAG: DNA polymerase III subunit delta [Gammaproteobacteria bacterium]|nr:DNA polymerase III subunit delta [Gammaproteobacteria bacterium]
MKVNARQLDGHLVRGLAPIYLISGDEPLLVTEAADRIRAHARGEGFEERDLLVAGRGFKWAELEASADTLSLFATRRIVELRLPTPRPGDAGSKVLQQLANRPDPDRLVLVVTGKLDSSASRGKWVKAIEANGVLVQIWPIDRTELPAWVRRRASALGVKLTQGAAEALADRIEGNLLAADQELRKLAILGRDTAIDEDEVLDAVANSARFDVFRLVDGLLAGDARRVFSVLAGLRSEGAEPALICWALSRELSLLARLHTALRQGQRLEGALTKHGVWQRRQVLVKRALERFTPDDVQRLLGQAAKADHVVKGVIPGNAWHALTQLLLLALDGRTLVNEVA